MTQTLSVFPHWRGTPALWSPLWPSSGPAPTGPCHSCARDPRAGCRTPGGVSPERSIGAESPSLRCWPRCFWCSPGYGWPSALQAHIAGSYLIFHPPVSPSSSWQGCSQAIHPPACIDTGERPDPGDINCLCRLILWQPEAILPNPFPYFSVHWKGMYWTRLSV